MMFPKDKNNPFRFQDFDINADSGSLREESQISDPDSKCGQILKGAIPRLLKSKHEESTVNSSYEELLFAVYQEIGVNPLKRLCFLEALEQYIKEWKRKTTPCLKEHAETSFEPTKSLLNLRVSSEESDSSWTLTIPSLKDFLRNILSSMRVLQVNETLSCPCVENICISNLDRYRMDFQEICLLGQGGFGTVFKAKHKLDGREYAVKKVQLSFTSPEECESLLREVRLLSEMRHPNIAQYSSSWLQLDYSLLRPRVTSEELYTFLDNSSQEEEEKSLYMNSSLPNSLKLTSSITPSILDIVFENSMKSESAFNPVSQNNYLNFISNTSHDINGINVSMRNLNIEENECSNISRESSVSTNSNNMDLIRFCPIDSPLLRVPTLYIQMELGNESLLSWIERRNDRVRENIFFWNRAEMERHFKIFKEILLALQYIHSKGIVHRDIKPANILISLNDHRVLLADFGLAKLFFDKDLSQRFLKKRKAQSSWVGTPTYSAPEITKKNNCNFKVDIYSLGIILLELMQPFNSMFERSKVIENLKNLRLLDSQVTSKWGRFSNLVLNMTDNDPLIRPSATEILYQIDKLCQFFPKSDTLLSSPLNTLSVHNASERNIQSAPQKCIRRSKTFTSGLNIVFSNFSTKKSSSLESLKRRNFIRKFMEYSSVNVSNKSKIKIRKLKSKVKALEKRIDELEKGRAIL